MGRPELLTLLAACAIGALCIGAGPAEADDKLKELIKSQGIVEIKLIEAQVPDMDPLPMQKESDVFVRVYLNDTKELVCETQVIQDENKPKVSCSACCSFVRGPARGLRRSVRLAGFR